VSRVPSKRPNGAEREPGEEEGAEEEGDQRASAAVLQRLGGRLRSGCADAEVASGGFETVGVQLDREGENDGCDKPERQKPEEDAKCHPACDQSASRSAGRCSRRSASSRIVARSACSAYFDARVRTELEPELEPADLPAEIQLSA